MQATGNPKEYADPTMRLVIFPTTESAATLGVETLESLEATAESLIDDDCKIIEAGETMEPIAFDGSCFELHTSVTSSDSLYIIPTAGYTGATFFAQHVPIEFERDMHYLKDSQGVDIEPLAEEGADGHEHAHGHGKKSGESCACVSII